MRYAIYINPFPTTQILARVHRSSELADVVVEAITRYVRSKVVLDRLRDSCEVGRNVKAKQSSARHYWLPSKRGIRVWAFQKSFADESENRDVVTSPLLSYNVSRFGSGCGQNRFQ